MPHLVILEIIRKYIMSWRYVDVELDVNEHEQSTSWTTWPVRRKQGLLKKQVAKIKPFKQKYAPQTN